MSTVIPILMSGGSGTRLWPLSRTTRPKQFLSLDGGPTLFETTLRRTSGAGEGFRFSAPLIISGARHAALVRSQLGAAGVEPRGVLLEPEARDTAAAIAAACAYLTAEGAGDEVVLVSPCDHVVRDSAAFLASVGEAVALARTGASVIFGIKPHHPATAYGYIKCGPADGAAGRPVEAFREKPNVETAEQFLAEGDVLWNAGIFVFTAAAGLAALELHAPAIAEAAAQAVSKAQANEHGLLLDAGGFAAAPRQPFDIAVMEKIAGARVISADWGWSDVGSWRAVHEVAQKDAAGNTVLGDVLLEDCRGMLARGDGATVTALGLEDLVIIATGDAVFVAPRQRSEDLKRVVSRLQETGREDLL